MDKLKDLQDNAWYCSQAHINLGKLLSNLGHLDTPVHYLSALQAIGRWLGELGEGLTEALKEADNDGKITVEPVED